MGTGNFPLECFLLFISLTVARMRLFAYWMFIERRNREHTYIVYTISMDGCFNLMYQVTSFIYFDCHNIINSTIENLFRLTSTISF